MSKSISFIKKIHFFLAQTLLFILPIDGNSQVTHMPSVKSQNNKGIIEKIVLTENETIVTIKFKSRDYSSIVFSSATILVPDNIYDINSARSYNLDYPKLAPTAEVNQLYLNVIKQINEQRKIFYEAGVLIKNLGQQKLDQYYMVNGGGQKYYYFELHFPPIPVGHEEIYIRELAEDGFEWVGIKINNPFPVTPHTGHTESTIKQKINEQNAGIVGIYEGTTEDNYKLGCINDDGTYKLVYLGSSNIMPQWEIGDLKATLRPTATPHLYKADWYMNDKSLVTHVYVAFDDSMMTVVYNNQESKFIKMYPIANKTSEWAGSGFAINDGYVVTNYHVIECAKCICVKGVGGDFNIPYKATVEVVDKHNDLALLKITDSAFSGFGSIPYSVKTSTVDVGEEVFVLGYPLTTIMGNEIKYTNGVVSSKTGLDGDISLYQISAPIQPGNSGSPLFDKNGTLIGIVNAKYTGAENVGYAIKMSYLRNLIESYTTEPLMPASDSLSSLTRSEQIKILKNYVFFIECTDSDNKDAQSITDNNDISQHNTFMPPIGATIKSIQSPYIKSKGDTNAFVSQVILSDEETIIEIVANRTNCILPGNSEWCNISGTTYIVANGKKLLLTQVEGIEIAPNKTYYHGSNQDIKFRLHFPRIPNETQLIDLIESIDSEVRFYGIQLK